MRSGTRTNMPTACLRSMLGNDPLITLGNVKVPIVVATGVSVSQRLVCVLLETPGYSRLEESQLTHYHHPPKAERQRYGSVAICVEYRDVDGSQSMRHPSEDTIEAYKDIRGAGHLLCAPSNLKRLTTSSTFLAAVDSFGSLTFAAREAPSNSTKLFAESLKTFP